MLERNQPGLLNPHNVPGILNPLGSSVRGAIHPQFQFQPTVSWFFGDKGAGEVDTLNTYGATPTFTRATTAWTKLSTGLWASIASGTPRSFYGGFTTAQGPYLGYLAEGAGTQLVTPTASIRDMTDASWVKVTMDVAKNATGIDGVANSASTLTATGATATILLTLVAAASSRTYSAWVRRKTGTGTIVLRQGTATLDITASINSTTYTRVELNDNELNVSFGFQIDTSGDEIEVDFNQFEAGAFATSPMAAAGAARNADVLTYPTTGWFNASAGTVFCEFTPFVAIGARILRVSDNTANEVLDHVLTTNPRAEFLVIDGGSTQADLVSAATDLTFDVSNKFATAYASNDFAASANGGSVLTDASGTLPTVSQINIGSRQSSDQQPFCPIRRITYYNSRLSNSHLQLLTAG